MIAFMLALLAALRMTLRRAGSRLSCCAFGHYKSGIRAGYSLCRYFRLRLGGLRDRLRALAVFRSSGRGRHNNLQELETDRPSSCLMRRVSWRESGDFWRGLYRGCFPAIFSPHAFGSRGFLDGSADCFSGFPHGCFGGTRAGSLASARGWRGNDGMHALAHILHTCRWRSVRFFRTFCRAYLGVHLTSLTITPLVVGHGSGCYSSAEPCFSIAPNYTRGQNYVMQ